jgi:multidrug efflux pump subunit AcrA (membrane-fusion protein)
MWRSDVLREYSRVNGVLPPLEGCIPKSHLRFASASFFSLLPSSHSTTQLNRPTHTDQRQQISKMADFDMNAAFTEFKKCVEAISARIQEHSSSKEKTTCDVKAQLAEVATTLTNIGNFVNTEANTEANIEAKADAAVKAAADATDEANTEQQARDKLSAKINAGIRFHVMNGSWPKAAIPVAHDLQGTFTKIIAAANADGRTKLTSDELAVVQKGFFAWLKAIDPQIKIPKYTPGVPIVALEYDDDDDDDDVKA